jgi:hypothetical protein
MMDPGDIRPSDVSAVGTQGLSTNSPQLIAAILNAAKAGMTPNDIFDTVMDALRAPAGTYHFQSLPSSPAIAGSDLTASLTSHPSVTPAGVVITVTNKIVGSTTVRGYPNNVTDSEGHNVLYSVPLYEVIVSGIDADGNPTSQSFSAIRFGVYNELNGPSVVGVNSGTFDLSWNGYLGGSWHVDGASNGGIFIHPGPADITQSYVGAIGCVEISGGGQWNEFNSFISSLGGTTGNISVTFQPVDTPPLTDSGRRFIYH